MIFLKVSMKLNTKHLADDLYELQITRTLLYAESISAWSNQDSVICLLFILNQ